MAPTSLSPANGGGVQLLRRWMLFAVSALAIAGAFAFLAVLTRTPAVQILKSAEDLHRVIAGHVTFSLLIWLLAFEAVLWILAGGRAVESRVPHWGLGLATLGSALLVVAVLWGRGAPILTDYVSVVVDPVFFAGLTAVGVGVGVVAWSSCITPPAGAGHLERGMRLAAVLAALAVGALSVVLLRLSVAGNLKADFAFFQSLFWIPGHLLQFVNVVAMVSTWYLLLPLGFEVAEPDGPIVRFAFRGYLLMAAPLFALALLADPLALPSNQRLSVAMGTALALPTAVHLGIVVRALARSRPRPASPEAAALLCSLGLFAGGVLLALARAGAASSMWIPAHYHAVVVGGVTIAFMGLTYRLILETGELAWARLAQVQPWLYGAGMLLMVIGMNWAGSSGAPRKTFDPALGAAAVRWMTPMNLMGLGGVIAVLGGGAFVGIAMWSLVWAPRREAVQETAPVIDLVSPS